MRKEDKQLVIQHLTELLKTYAHFYLVDVTAMNAEYTNRVRSKCFNQDIKMVLVKNSLLRKAFEASDIDYSPLFGCLKGTTAIMFCNVANVPAKLIKESSKDSVLSLKAAYAEEDFYIGNEQIDALTAIKSKNDIIAEIIVLLQLPIKNVVSAIESGGRTIHGILKTLGEHSE